MRMKPYTELGIRRIKCFRCDNKAVYQWQICSDKNQYRPVCAKCDIELNKLVVMFMKFPNAEEMISQYEKTVNDYIKK